MLADSSRQRPAFPPGRARRGPLQEQVVEVLREGIPDFRLKPGQLRIHCGLVEQTGV